MLIVSQLMMRFFSFDLMLLLVGTTRLREQYYAYVLGEDHVLVSWDKIDCGSATWFLNLCGKGCNYTNVTVCVWEGGLGAVVKVWFPILF